MPSQQKSLEGPAAPGHIIRQERSRKTYEALVATGFKLLAKHEFESVTIAGLARAAGYSVGAFYARFSSKDEFFEAMVAHHILERRRAREQILSTTPSDTLIQVLIEDIVDYYWRHRRFWRAALMRSAGDPEFWRPINESAAEYIALLIDRIQRDAGRPLSETECANIRFAARMVLGLVNNRIVNRPWPSLTGEPAFIDNLTRAFRLIADWEALTGRPLPGGR